MKVELLYFDECPTYRTVRKALAEILSEERMAAEVHLVAVNTDEEAERHRFPGSPTVRVDGGDLFPVPERESYALGCRTYSTPEGLRGHPTKEMLAEALAARRTESKWGA